MKNSLFDIYPFNMSLDIFENAADAKAIHIDNLLDEVSQLDERNQMAIRLRYEEGLTLREVGERMGVGSERARQFIVYALRLLRNPARLKKYRAVPYIEKVVLEKENSGLEGENSTLREALEELKLSDESVIETARQVSEYKALMEMSVSELQMGHSIHSILIRAGIRKVRDLREYSVKDLIKLDGIGIKTAERVMERLEELGFKNQEKQIKKQ